MAGGLSATAQHTTSNSKAATGSNAKSYEMARTRAGNAPSIRLKNKIAHGSEAHTRINTGPLHEAVTAQAATGASRM